MRSLGAVFLKLTSGVQLDSLVDISAGEVLIMRPKERCPSGQKDTRCTGSGEEIPRTDIFKLPEEYARNVPAVPGIFRLVFHTQCQIRAARSPGGDVGVAVGVRIVFRSGQIFDIELKLQLRRDRPVDRAVDAGVAVERHIVADPGIGLVARQHADGGTPFRRDVIAVPDAEAVLRRLGQYLAGRGRANGLDRLGVLIGIGRDDLPGRGDLAVQRQFDAFDTLRVARQQDQLGAVGRIGDRGIAAVQPIDRARQGQGRANVPLGADFGVLELFGIERLVGDAERGQLFARTRHVGDAVAGVDRGIGDRLVDQADARGDQVVGRGQVARGRGIGAQIGQLGFEAVVADANDGLPLVVEGDLVLQVQGGDIDDAGVQRIRSRLGEGKRYADRRVAEADDAVGRRAAGQAGAVRQGERTGFAAVVGVLAADFDAGQERVFDAAGVGGKDQVGLVEGIVADGGVIIGLDADRRAGRIDTGREDVLVELVIIGDARAVAKGHTVVEPVLDKGLEGVDLGEGRAARRVAEEGRTVGRDRVAGAAGGNAVAGDATIGDALVLVELIADGDQGSVAGAEGEGGVEALALIGHAVAIAGRVFVQAGNAERDFAGQVMAEIDRRALLFERPQLHVQAAEFGEVGDLGDAVEQAAGAATAEDHGVWPLEGLDPFNIIGVAIILDVVADTVNEEVGGVGVAAEDETIAVALSLRRTEPRHITNRFRHGLNILVIDLLFADHRYRLRHVQQCGVSFCRGTGDLGIISRALALHDDDRLFGLVGNSNRCLKRHERRTREQP